MSRDLVISIDEKLLAEASGRAASEHQTLDQLVQQWLAEYVAGQDRIARYRQLMGRLNHVHAPEHPLTRDELNER
jgi:hypothetical protein